jgi:hypothetical protein
MESLDVLTHFEFEFNPADLIQKLFMFCRCDKLRRATHWTDHAAPFVGANRCD